MSKKQGSLDPEGLQLESGHSEVDAMRHSCEHVMAAALMKLWPHIKRGVGPVIENGFYQDFETGKESVSLEDFSKIQKEMEKIKQKRLPIVRSEMDIDEAITFYKKEEQPYKVEILEDLKKMGEKRVSFYTIGDYTDLCKGPHVDNTLKIGHFKLTRLAGAYWRGSEKNKMLQRLYGVSFPSKKELDEYLWRQEEAQKRDHKKLGKELDLFTFSDLVGPGLPLWTPKGTVVRQILDEFVWSLRKAKGYQRVEIPHITKKELYIKSGHWDKFKDELFKITTREGHEFAMKPMNCPHHTQIYDHLPRSYRDLPQRYANTTMCYRDEQTGELSGLSRVRAFTQDDAHVFCRTTQVKEEILKIWDIVDTFYAAAGFKLNVRLSLHDPEHFEKYLGQEASWKQAESDLRELAAERKVSVFEAVGEAAFYGPKLDFMAEDSLGRQWQIATIQLDMNMPERFDLACTNEHGERERIVMVHAAIMGSIERFLSILIEHFAGAFPVWLAPVQVALIPIAERHLDYAREVAHKLEERGVRVELFERNESMQLKIRDAQKQKVPYMLVMGDREQEAGNVAIRVRSGENLPPMAVNDFVEKITLDIAKKA